jgi:hypothetical protein
MENSQRKEHRYRIQHARNRSSCVHFAHLLLFTVAAGTAIAGPPFRTDDPIPIGFRHAELYLFSTGVSDHDVTTGIGPAVEFNYGALPDVHLHIILPLAFSAPRDETSRIGFGDTELGIKYRFVHQTDVVPAIGSFPIVEVPTGNAERDLGNGATQVYLPLWLQKDIGNWTTYGGAGYWINSGSGNMNWTFTGLLVQYNFSDNAFLGMEIFHQTRASIYSPGNTGIHIGGGLPILAQSQFIFSADAGNGITSYKHFAYYVGLYHAF